MVCLVWLVTFLFRSESLDLESEVQRLIGLVDRLTLRVVSLEDRLAEVERFWQI